MNWFKQNRFLSTYLSVVVVVSLILGYFLYSSYARFTSISEEYDSQVARLQALQNRSPYPSEENLHAYKGLTKDYKAEYDKLVAQLQSMSLPVEDLSPQAFQDRLQAIVSEVTKRAGEIGSKLPDGFYMGFDRYRDQLPGVNAAGPLARQLNAIKIVVDNLLQNRVASIAGIQRSALPEEGGGEPGAAGAGAQRSGGSSRAGSGPQPSGTQQSRNEGSSIVTANPFIIQFSAEQGRARQALNAIANSKAFLIIRTLSIENSSLEGPKRGAETAGAPEPTPAQDVAGSPAATSEAAPIQALTVVVGRETINVAAKIELVTFAPPAPPKQN